MSGYAVVKVSRDTGQVVAVIARGMLFHHADRFAAEVGRSVEPGHYMTARNELDVDETATAQPGPMDGNRLGRYRKEA